MIKAFMIFFLIVETGTQSTITSVGSFVPKKLDGVYRTSNEYQYSGVELLGFDSRTKEFYLKRLESKNIDYPEIFCTDTIAKGKFKFISSDVAVLSNDSSFLAINYEMKKTVDLSKDTVYIKIDLPEDKEFYTHRFRFIFKILRYGPPIEIDSPILKIARNKIQGYGAGNFGLTIQDLGLSYSSGDSKCYSRTIYRVFDKFQLDTINNCYNVELPGFNECFIERMDVEDDLIYVKKDNVVIWRGWTYEKADD
jgi:hypothetical protein